MTTFKLFLFLVVTGLLMAFISIGIARDFDRVEKAENEEIERIKSQQSRTNRADIQG